MEEFQILAMSDLTESEILMFQNEFNVARKSRTVGILLAFFLGGVGGHRFYMGQIGLGMIYLLLFIPVIIIVPFGAFIPAIIAIIECFLMPSRVKKHNSNRALEIATMIKSLRK